MTPLLLSVTALLCYTLGCVDGALIASRFVFHRRVRAAKGTTPGLREYYRSFGLRGVLLILGVDAVKTLLAVLLGWLLLNVVEAGNVGKLFGAFCMLLGHTYPIPRRFRGGTGVFCFCVMALAFDWRVGMGCVAVYLIALVFSRYVALSSLIAAGFCPLLIWMTGYETLEGEIAVLIAVLLAVRHAENILRMVNGTEPRLNLKRTDAYGNREE